MTDYFVRSLRGYALAAVGGVLLTLLAVWWLQPKPVVQVQQDGSDRVLVPKTEIRPADVAPFITSPIAIPAVSRAREAGSTVTAVGVTSGTVKIPPVFNQGEPFVIPEQRIEAVAVAGQDKQGIPTLAVDLFTVAPNSGQRTPILGTHTVVVSQPNKPRWNTTFAVQAGVGLGPVGIVGVRWLQYGESWQAESNWWALLSFGVRVDSKTVQPALLPVSVNVGHLTRHKMLFRDLWVSPVVSWDGSTPRYGAAVTATF